MEKTRWRQEILHTLHEAKVLIEHWRQHCNGIHAHRSLD